MSIFIYLYFTPEWFGCYTRFVQKLVIVIPTYNEKGNIAKLLRSILKTKIDAKRWRMEVLVVDDNSPDGTGKIVNLLSRKTKNIHLLSRTKKVGLGAAYLAGMRDAFNKYKADLVMTMDADLSHNSSYIPNFLAEVEGGADMVIGSRYIKGGSIPKEWGIHRKIYSVLGNKVTSLLLGTVKINDWTSGFRVIKRKVFDKVSPQVQGTITQGYTFNIAFAYFAYMSGFLVSHTPIKFPDRSHGKSKLGLEYLVRTPIFLIKTRLGKLLSV